jgi:glycyl-radical enzyme activating protein
METEAPPHTPTPAQPTATVFHIERHCLHDGPGIRTLVFFKGCPLRCGWCSNPEGQARGPELVYDAAACRGCGACIPVCPAGAVGWAPGSGDERRVATDRCACDPQLAAGSCQAACVPVCPAGARSVAGRTLGVEEVLRVVLRDEPFYRHSGGGVTASGGEPLVYPEFVADLFRRCGAHGVHTAMETCGNVPWRRFQLVLPVTDLFLFDLKHADPARHRQETGADNQRIIRNLRALQEAGKQVIVRVPVIPGFNDSLEDITAIADLAFPAAGEGEMHLLPFHRLGISKYRKLEKDWPMGGVEPPGLAYVHELADALGRPGLRVLVDV